jgi:AAA domain-containing protein
MPILKANEPLPERPVVIALYGEPGSCKTTLGNTAEEVLVLDFDRGVSRSFHRQTTLIINSWADVQEEERAGSFKNYKTIVIDTAKAALDDFLMGFVTERDYKLKTNKLKAYGELGDEFKLFLNNRRNEGLDVIIIAHAKKDEDTKKSIPDVTGQSYQLILRVADQVGYVSFVNNERTIQWTPTDLTVGKNTANLPTMRIPDKSNPALKAFMAEVITSVKKSIVCMSEEQREALAKSETIQDELNASDTPEKLTELLIKVHSLPEYLKAPMQKLIGDKAKASGWVANKEKKCFELPAPVNPAAAETTGKEQREPKPEHQETPSETETQEEDQSSALDDRCLILGQLGMSMEMDRAVLGDINVTYDSLEAMNEDSFNQLIISVTTAKKKGKKTTPKKAVA